MSADWQAMQLGDFIELKRGYDLPKKQRSTGSIPIVSSAGISDLHNKSKVNGPGVVTGRYGTIGEVFFVREDFWPLNTTLYVRDFKGNDPQFIYYLLKTIDYSKYSDKAAVPGVNRNHLHMATIRVPKSVFEQRRIAEILGGLDDKIQLNHQINQTLEQMAQAIFKSWFVDFEPVKAKIAAKESWQALQAEGEAETLPDLETWMNLAAMQVISGQTEEALNQMADQQPEQFSELFKTAALFPAAMQDSELGEIPEGWEVSQIGDEVISVGGTTPSTKNPAFWEGGEINWTSPKDLSSLADKVLISTERKITEEGLKKISSGLLPENTVLMSSRAPVGYLVLTKIPVAINQGYIAMKCSKTLTPEFVLQWCSANMEEIKGRASGTTFAEISKSNFRIIPVVVPHGQLLLGYSKQASSIYSAIEANIRESASLSSLRDTLLPKLLSGELSVADLELEEA